MFSLSPNFFTFFTSLDATPSNHRARGREKERERKREKMSSSMAETNSALVAGIELCAVPDLNASLEASFDSGFNYIAVPLVHPRSRCDARGVSERRQLSAPFTRSDLLLGGSVWTTRVVGVISPWIAAEIEEAGRASFRCLADARDGVAAPGHADTDGPVGGGRLGPAATSTVRVVRDAEAALKRELAWSSHLGVPAVLLPAPAGRLCRNYARLVWGGDAGG